MTLVAHNLINCKHEPYIPEDKYQDKYQDPVEVRGKFPR